MTFIQCSLNVIKAPLGSASVEKFYKSKENIRSNIKVKCEYYDSKRGKAIFGNILIVWVFSGNFENAFKVKKLLYINWKHPI